MNAAPPLLTGIVVLFAALVMVGRWLLVNETTTDHLINRTLIWVIGSVLGYAIAAGLGYPDFGQRLFLAVGAGSLSGYFGFVALFGRADPRTWRRHQRSYDAIAATFGTFVLICAGAEAAGLPLHRSVDWERIAWAAVYLVLAWTGVLLGRACVRELRNAAPTRRERLTYSALLLFGVYSVDSAFYAMLQLISGGPPGRPGTVGVVGSFLGMAVLTALIAIPLINAIIVRAELDRTGRQCRRLRPLWLDLTDAVPEVVLHSADAARQGSAARLYRMTIEIGDALLHLRQFAPDTAAPHADTISSFAMRIAEAVEHKRRGLPVPNRTGHPRSAIRPPADDRTAELRNLLALSREWPKARAAVETPADA
ncbi:hypothetical protein F3087_22940 [Nocardia colli]|uniref:DUF6545 domain-containing protein n=1 Tax=Nocardia colli TaxID=2545717 RepID=A0A5N0ECI7_9NOCA|nr:MAB_1171c family putative transporter [Nocardia colli]KAA8886633.1 hypothetical protein F3087_22940 [Nocardia colli]